MTAEWTVAKDTRGTEVQMWTCCFLTSTSTQPCFHLLPVFRIDLAPGREPCGRPLRVRNSATGGSSMTCTPDSTTIDLYALTQEQLENCPNTSFCPYIIEPMTDPMVRGTTPRLHLVDNPVCSHCYSTRAARDMIYPRRLSQCHMRAYIAFRCHRIFCLSIMS